MVVLTAGDQLGDCDGGARVTVGGEDCVVCSIEALWAASSKHGSQKY